MEHLIKWEGDRKEFPRGPMYWVNSGGEGEGETGRAGKTGFDMEALAVGAEGGNERREKVCRLETRFPETAVEINGHADPVAIKKEMLTAPTETDLPSTLLQVPGQPQPQGEVKEEGKAEGEEKVVIQEGALIPASRPEPVSFVTATEGIDTLNEKTDNLALNGGIESPKENGNGPHQTTTANLLDSSVALNGKAASDSAVGTGVEEADKAHKNGSQDVGGGMVEQAKETIEVSA
jgi:hypothetical protein